MNAPLRTLLTPLLGLVLLGNHSLHAQGRATVTLEELGVQTSFGLGQGRLDVLAKPIGARFVGSNVVILDAAAPWVRMFDRQGNFIRSFSTIGDGPGEVRRPFSLAATSDGGVLLGHTAGIERFSAEGVHMRSIRGVRASGTIEACGGLLTLIEPIASNSWSTALIRMDAQGAVSDTIMRVTSARGRSRNYHPWFAQPTSEGILLYPEDRYNNRIVEVDCDGRTRRELRIAPLGPGDSVAIRGDMTGYRSPKPPYPAGLARIQNRVIWAARAVNEGSEQVTTITAFDQSGRARQVVLSGWYQLLDSDPAGALLLTNSWTDGQNWQYGGTSGTPAPVVHLLDGNALIRMIDARGTTSGADGG